MVFESILAKVNDFDSNRLCNLQRFSILASLQQHMRFLFDLNRVFFCFKSFGDHSVDCLIIKFLGTLLLLWRKVPQTESSSSAVKHRNQIWSKLRRERKWKHSIWSIKEERSPFRLILYWMPAGWEFTIFSRWIHRFNTSDEVWFAWKCRHLRNWATLMMICDYYFFIQYKSINVSLSVSDFLVFGSWYRSDRREN